MHTAESVLDTVGPDTGAENVAAWIVRRDTPGSYHDLVDGDSCVPVVRWECEAFHDGTGTNPHSYGLSFALRTTDWRTLSPARRALFVDQGAQAAARWARWMRARHGVVVPARRITRAESDRGVPGFISHGERDPARRTDPGADFPWGEFLSRYAALMQQPHPNGDDDMQQDEREALMGIAFLTRVMFETDNPNGVANTNVGVRGGKTKPVSDRWRWARESVLLDRDVPSQIAALGGQVAGLTAAVEALAVSGGAGVDVAKLLDAVTSAAQQGARDALDGLAVHVESTARLDLDDLAAAAKVAAATES